MAGYIGSKAVLLSTTAATVTGDAQIGGDLTVDTDTLFVNATNNRVGIETSSPDSSLHVEDDGAFPITLTRNGGTNSNASIRWKQATTSWYAGVNAANSFAFKYDNPDLATGNALAITSTGSVGIGTGSPSYKIEAIGSSPAFFGVSSGDGTQVGYRATIPSNSVNCFVGWVPSGVAGINGDLALCPRTSTNARILFFTGTTTPSERMRIDASGNLLVGTTVAAGVDGITLQKNGTNPRILFNKSFTGTSGQVLFYYQGTVIGGISTSTTSTAYNTSSDYRLKENVVPLAGAADRLAQIPVHRFNFIADPDKTVDGFLAHEVQAFVPECVTGEKDQVETVEVTDEDGNVTTEERPVYQGIDQSKLVPLLTAALQEALTEIQDLKARVATLEGGAA